MQLLGHPGMLLSCMLQGDDNREQHWAAAGARVAVVATSQQPSGCADNDSFEDAAVLDGDSRSLSASSGVELVQRGGTLTRRAKGARSLSMESSSPGGWRRETVSWPADPCTALLEALLVARAMLGLLVCSLYSAGLPCLDPQRLHHAWLAPEVR